jgi:hypothetical protein
MESFHPASLSLVARVLMTLPSLATISPTSKLTLASKDRQSRSQRQLESRSAGDADSASLLPFPTYTLAHYPSSSLMQFDFGTDLKNDERKPFMSSSKVVTILFLVVIRKKEPLELRNSIAKSVMYLTFKFFGVVSDAMNPRNKKGSLGENGKNMLDPIVKSSREIKGYLYY